MFSSIRCPTLIFYDGADRLESVRNRWSRLQDVEVHALEGTCHHIHLEYPDKIYKEILVFLREKMGARAAAKL